MAERRLPQIPSCCAPDRLAALEAIETLVANDAARTVAHLVEIGFPEHNAIEATRLCYLSWIVGRFVDAIELGVDWAETSLRQAA